MIPVPLFPGGEDEARSRIIQSLPAGRRDPLRSSLLLITAGPVPSSEGRKEIVTYGIGSWDPESGLGNHRVIVRVEAPAAPVPDKAGQGLPEACGGDRTGPPAGRARQDRLAPARPRAGEEERRRHRRHDRRTRPQGTAGEHRPRSGRNSFSSPRPSPATIISITCPTSPKAARTIPASSTIRPRGRRIPAWPPERPACIRATSPRPPGPRKTSSKPRSSPSSRPTRSAPSRRWSRIATSAERKALLDAHPGASYLLFPEDRSLSIRMTDDIPERWAASGPRGTLRGQAARGEYFTYQIGLWAARQAVTDLDVRFTDLVRSEDATGNGDGAPVTTIPAKDMTCINEGGVDWDGSPLVKAVPVGLGRVQALWCGVPVPVGARPGVYKGTATVAPAGLPETIVGIELEVTGEVLEDRGDADPHRMTRLRWLDSRLAQDDGVVPPYTPLTVEKFTVSCLGRSLAIGRDGFPARIRSYFAPEMTRLRSGGRRRAGRARRAPRRRRRRPRTRLDAQPDRTAALAAGTRDRGLGGRQLQRRPADAARGPHGVRRLRRLPRRGHGPARRRPVGHPPRGPVQRRQRPLHDGPRLQGRGAPRDLRVEPGTKKRTRTRSGSAP